MTVDEHLRMVIGDLVVRVAQLAAEVDALKAMAPQTKGNGADYTGTRGTDPQRATVRE